jgi:hypothetical protein
MHGDAYPEVHTPAGVTLRWSGVETQCTPNATMTHRILLEHCHQKKILDPLRDWPTRTSLGRAP